MRIRDRAGSAVFMACRQIGQTSPRRATLAPARAQSERAGAKFVCSDPRIEASLDELGAALALKMPVHIFGETGTGKELMARHIHEVYAAPGSSSP